jgi:hypothetical protein
VLIVPPVALIEVGTLGISTVVTLTEVVTVL